MHHKKAQFGFLCALFLSALASGVFALGTPSGTIITNAKQAGGAFVLFRTATNQGALSVMFTNLGNVTNSGYVDGTSVLVTVTNGRDLSKISFTNLRTNNGAIAGAEVNFGGYFTNYGNFSETVYFQVTNIAGTVGWPGAIFTLYTNSVMAVGPSVANILFAKNNVSVGAVVKYLLTMDVPGSMANGATNMAFLRIENSAGIVGDSWPPTGAIVPATPDTLNLRDSQKVTLVARVQGPVLRLSKTASVGATRPYELIVYTIRYTNAGATGAMGVTIRDIIPNTVTNASNLRIELNGGGYAAAGANGSVVGKVVKFTPNAGTIGAGQYGRLEFTVRVK